MHMAKPPPKLEHTHINSYAHNGLRISYGYQQARVQLSFAVSQRLLVPSALVASALVGSAVVPSALVPGEVRLQKPPTILTRL